MQKKYLIFILLISLLLCNCSINRMVMNAAAGFMDDGITVVYQEDDLELAEQFLGNNLKMLEIMIARDPENSRLNLIAAQGFGAYAMAFVEDENPKRAARLYQRALGYSFRALPEKKSFDKTIKPRELEELLLTYEKEDVPQLFWLGYNWGNYVLQHLDDPRNLVNLSKVEMIMSRCLELDEEYNFGGVDLFYANFYAARPPMLGGDPEKGKEFFLRNIEINDDKFFMAKYFYARYYAVQVQDEELFDKLLDEVISLDLDKYPEVKLMNSIAKKKAIELHKNKNTYF